MTFAIHSAPHDGSEPCNESSPSLKLDMRRVPRRVLRNAYAVLCPSVLPLP